MLNKLKITLLFALGFISCKNLNTHETPVKVSTTETKNGEITKVSGERKISGIYPHLTTYAHGRENGQYGFGLECGIGALAVWNDNLYMVNYAAHEPKGSEHKLYTIDKDKNMQIFEGSVGGTPASRMVHQESNQLFIGHYVIAADGSIRVIPISKLEGRLTAIARHLKDPENKVYYYDMEGMLYEVNVHTLEVTKLFEDPLPGWHGKGGYTTQGKLVVSNNGENTSNDKWDDNWKIENNGEIIGKGRIGVLAEYDGVDFKIIERKQYTDVTTKNGVFAIPNDNSPLWAVGWDNKSIRLKVLDKGVWSTFLMPKATYNNDPEHGWFTEWPRIRAISEDKLMMDMHGMFFDFPKTFSAENTSGIKPISSHLRYIPDFTFWNDQIVLATDETSIQGNPLAGQPQSNLWFGTYDDLKEWGPATAYGAIWLNEPVKRNIPSDPFLISGFDNRIIHFNNHGISKTKLRIEIDKGGKGTWTLHKEISLNENEYKTVYLETELKSEWIRIVTENDAILTASLHLTDKDYRDSHEGEKMFSAIANIDYEEEVSHSILYSNKQNFNLSVYDGIISNGKFQTTNEREFTKYNFKFANGIKDSTAVNALKLKDIWEEDDASIILKAKHYQVRLPKLPGEFSKKMPSRAVRSVRELESERELANIAGAFYELPLFYIGQEPLYKMMRPITSHGKQISDFNTWNGLLVLNGVKADAEASNHVYKSEDGKSSLWFGGIDDLWKFGKPVGEGGPWKDTNVISGEISDLYLMTGYDKKTVKLKADKDTEVTIMIHINPYLEEAFEYKTFNLKANKEVTYEFPQGFSAHWVQVVSSENCKATAWFVYK